MGPVRAGRTRNGGVELMLHQPALCVVIALSLPFPIASATHSATLFEIVGDQVLARHRVKSSAAELLSLNVHGQTLKRLGLSVFADIRLIDTHSTSTASTTDVCLGEIVTPKQVAARTILSPGRVYTGGSTLPRGPEFQPLAIPIWLALPTNPGAAFKGAGNQVVSRICVSLRAVSAARHEGGNGIVGPEGVLSWSYGPDMEGVTAERIVAREMVQHHAIWDRPDLQFVADTVGSSKALISGVLRKSVTIAGTSYPDMTPAPDDHIARKFVHAMMPRDKGDSYLALYFLMYLVEYALLHVLHLPSLSRFLPTSLWPRLQYRRFMLSNVSHSWITYNG